MSKLFIQVLKERLRRKQDWRFSPSSRPLTIFYEGQYYCLGEVLALTADLVAIANGISKEAVEAVADVIERMDIDNCGIAVKFYGYAAEDFENGD